MKIETKFPNKVTYSFSKEEFEGHAFYALKKFVPPYKEGTKPKFQIITCGIENLPQFKEFLKKIINEG
jgi:hypothetical protein